jgi:hypothetical protein
VRQIDDLDRFWSLPLKNLDLRELSPFDPSVFDGRTFRHIMKPVETDLGMESTPKRLTKETIYDCLKCLIARESSSFDVMKVFSRFLERKMESDQICEEAW